MDSFEKAAIASSFTEPKIQKEVEKIEHRNDEDFTRGFIHRAIPLQVECNIWYDA
jgi:hypothetical protein